MPEGTDADLIDMLREAGVGNILEYAPEDTADRLEKVNSVPNAAFSRTEEEVKGLELPRAEETEKPKKEKPKPVAESKPIEAKRWLNRQIMDSFGIRENKTEAANIIQKYADKVLKEGAVTDQDVGELFGQLYDQGVIDIFPDDYSRAMRELVTGGQIQVTPSLKADYGDDWSSFRKKAFSARAGTQSFRNSDLTFRDETSF